MEPAVHLILFLGFWAAVIWAAYREPWWLPVPVGAIAAALFGLVAATLQDRASLAGFAAAGLGGSFSGLIVVGIRAIMRRVRRDPFEARAEQGAEPEKPAEVTPAEWPRIKGWPKDDPQDLGH